MICTMNDGSDIDDGFFCFSAAFTHALMEQWVPEEIGEAGQFGLPKRPINVLCQSITKLARGACNVWLYSGLYSGCLSMWPAGSCLCL